MKRLPFPRRLVRASSVACAAALFAASPTLAAVASRSAWGRAVSAASNCTTAGLVVWMNTQGNGAAGSMYYLLQFTNLSGRTCVLRGYPGVSGADLAGRRVGSAAGRNPSTPVRTVTLRPGTTAKAVLRITDVFNFPAASCGPATAAGLRVYPPNQTASKLVPFPFAACSRSGPVYLQIAPVS